MASSEIANPRTPVEKVLLKRLKKSKKANRALHTQVPNVDLTIRRGEDITIDTIGRRDVRTLIAAGSRYAAKQSRIDAMKTKQDKDRAKITAIIEAHDYIVGMQAPSRGFKLAITPKEKITWDRTNLKKDLGDTYTAVAKEKLVTSIVVPFGVATSEGPLTSDLLHQTIMNSLETLGLSKSVLATIVKPEVELHVDENILGEMINEGRIHLADSVGSVATSRSIKVDTLDDTAL